MRLTTVSDLRAVLMPLAQDAPLDVLVNGHAVISCQVEGMVDGARGVRLRLTVPKADTPVSNPDEAQKKARQARGRVSKSDHAKKKS